MDEIFFDGWTGLLRTIVIGVLAYIFLIVTLRISGKRTLAKMNAFDLVVTVSLGSTLATILLNKDVALAEGAVALTLLVALQYAVTWSSVRSAWVRKLAKSEPRLLIHDGQMLSAALRDERVTEDELTAAIRSAGLPGLGNAHAVILETDGTFSVITRGESLGQSTLQGMNVPHQPPSP